MSCKDCEFNWTLPWWWLCVLIDVAIFYGMCYVWSTYLDYPLAHTGTMKDPWWQFPTSTGFSVVCIIVGIIVWPLLAKRK